MKLKSSVLYLYSVVCAILFASISCEVSAVPFKKILPFKNKNSAESDLSASSNASKSKKGKQEQAKLEKEILKVGDPAPDIALSDQSGKIVSLGQFKNKKSVVLFFYPKDNTSVCTKEACSFRDDYAKFKELGAELIGVSSDSSDSHREFAEKYNLEFPLLADTSNMARKAFAVPNSAKLLPGRVTYVIDKSGIVKLIYNDMMNGEKHAAEALKILKENCAQ